ncbi:MAG: hypothetical protein Q7O66_18855, partial [Dehalococcoidia bacterium]|nr:hypothetical protein [Dehalococcoidia bacterium]
MLSLLIFAKSFSSTTAYVATHPTLYVNWPVFSAFPTRWSANVCSPLSSIYAIPTTPSVSASFWDVTLSRITSRPMYWLKVTSESEVVAMIAELSAAQQRRQDPLLVAELSFPALLALLPLTLPVPPGTPPSPK